jgi:hypothetical protein
VCSCRGVFERVSQFDAVGLGSAPPPDAAGAAAAPVAWKVQVGQILASARMLRCEWAWKRTAQLATTGAFAGPLIIGNSLVILLEVLFGGG